MDSTSEALRIPLESPTSPTTFDIEDGTFKGMVHIYRLLWDRENKAGTKRPGPTPSWRRLSPRDHGQTISLDLGTMPSTWVQDGISWSRNC